MQFRTTIAAAAAVSALALAGSAAPALASTPGPSSSGPVSAKVTTLPALSLTLSGLTNITFPTMRAGTPDSASEQYSVETTDTGYSVTITAGDSGMRGAASANDFIGNTNISLTDTGNGAPGTPVQLVNSSSPVTLATVSGLDGADHTFAYAESWALNIPAATPADTYTESFIYTAIGA